MNLIKISPVFKGILFLVFCLTSCVQKPGEVKEPEPAPQSPIDPQVAAVIKSFFDEALGERASYGLLEALCKDVGPRLSGSKGAKAAVGWAKKVMDDEGFDEVYLQEVMVPYWERGKAEEAHIILADGQKEILSILAVGGSVPTPPEGITAEVIEVQSVDELEALGQENIQGKIVFFNQEFDQRNISQTTSYGATIRQRTQGAVEAAVYGAVASVIRSLSSGFDDAPHTGTMSYKEELDSIPHGALGVKSAELLSERIKTGPVTMHMKINSQWHPDARSHNVIGTLKGSEFPTEVITIGGHLDSWDVGEGAHDDGAGCVHALGVLKLFKKLGIEPKRTIRAVMFMNEENGLKGGIKYAENAQHEKENHLVAIESDAGGFSPRGFGVTASDEQLEKVRSWLPYFNPNTIAFINKGGGGADIRPLYDAMGTPTIGLMTEGQRVFDYHHSANDIFENVHPRELELGTASLAALVYLIDQNGF